MGVSPSGSHHRRRSSVLAATSASSQSAIPIPPLPEETKDIHNSNLIEVEDHSQEDHKAAEDTDLLSDLSSIAESVEMDYISSDDDIHDDEETGLTAKQRRQRRRRRKQRRQLDARIAGVKASRQDGHGHHHDHHGLGRADRNVAQRLLVNAILIGLWYFFSLAISLYNKWMFSKSKDAVVFPFPLFTTSMHMVVQFTLSSLILYAIPSLRPRHPPSSLATAENTPVLTKFFYLTRLVPCAVATSLDIGLGNMSLKFITLTFLTMCKSSALAFVLIFAFVFRLETPSVKLILIIATMTVGVVMMVAGEAAFNAVGFALIIASAFFSGFRWGLTQILLLRHPATSNPFSTLFFLNPVMFISLIVIALAVEGPAEISQGFMALTDAHGTLMGVLFLIFPGILAFCMIASEFALLKRSSVVTLSICGIFKEVVTISAAGVVFHDKLTPVNVSGLIVTIASIASYNYMKISKMRRDAREEVVARSEDPDSGADYFDPASTSNAETGLLSSSPNARVDHDANIAPAGDLISPRNSVRVRASATGTGVHSLAVPTSIINDQDRQFSPRLEPRSNMERVASPRIRSNSPI